MGTANITWINDRIGYIPLRVAVGIVKIDGGPEVVLIDSGFDDDTGRKILRFIAEDSLRPRYILLTHAHADHRGGANIIRARTGAKTVAPLYEAELSRSPALFASILYGSSPPAVLRNKVLVGDEPTVIDGEPSDYDSDLNFVKWIELKGHSPGHSGILAGDVIFTGDAFVSKENLAKYGFNVFYDYLDFIDSIDKLAAFKADAYIASHGGKYTKEDVLVHLAANRKVAENIMEAVSSSLGEATLDSITRCVARKFLVNPTLNEYLFLRCCVAGCLSHLSDKGVITFRVENGGLLATKSSR